MNFPCPLPAALTAITLSNCPFRFDQIVRMEFQQRQSAAPFTNLAAIQTLSNWTTLLAASDATKIVTSPIFSGMVIPGSEGTFAGANDNANFAGIEDYYGENTVRATGTFKNLGTQTKLDLDKLTPFSLANSIGISTLTVVMFNKDGVGFAQSDFSGIPIYNFRLGSAGSEGLNKANISAFSFTLRENWDRNLVSFKPTFDPLTAL